MGEDKFWAHPKRVALWWRDVSLSLLATFRNGWMQLLAAALDGFEPLVGCSDLETSSTSPSSQNCRPLGQPFELKLRLCRL